MHRGKTYIYRYRFEQLTELQTRWCLDDRLTLSDKELYAVADDSDKETEEHDLEKLGKDNGGISALINLNVTSAIKR